MSAELNKISCPECSSNKIRKHGIKKNKQSTIQRYKCKDCKKTFTLKQELKNKSYQTNIILSTISLYNSGNSQTQTPPPHKKSPKNFSNLHDFS